MKKLLFLLLLSTTSFYAQDYWTEYPTSQPAASTGMRSISIVDANVAWLSNSCGTTGCTPIRRFSRTINGGTVWNTGAIDLGASSANLEIANIHGVSATVAFASVFPKPNSIGGVWKTVDAGVSWSRQPSATYGSADSFTNIVYFWDANNGVTMGDPDSGYFEIYTTTNGGTTWVRTPSANIPLPLSPGPEYGLTNQFEVTGNTIWMGTTSGRIYKSIDKGYNWTVSQSPIPDFGGGLNGTGSGKMAFLDANNGILNTNDFLLYKTTDGGVTWNEVIYNGELKSRGVAAIPGTSNYVSVGTDAINDPARGSSYSVDGGLNWYNIDNNPDVNTVDGFVVAFLDNNTGFASGFSTSAVIGGIFKWNGKTLLGDTKFSNDKLFALAPNPTSGKMTLSGANISQVEIIDILGKVVSNNSYNALSEVSVDLTSMNSGIYLVKVTNDAGKSSIIKAIKE